MRSKPASQVPSGVIDVGHWGVALVDSRSTVPVPSAACLYTLGTPARPDSKMICRPSGVQTDIPSPPGSKVRRLSVSCAKSQIQMSVSDRRFQPPRASRQATGAACHRRAAALQSVLHVPFDRPRRSARGVASSLSPAPM